MKIERHHIHQQGEQKSSFKFYNMLVKNVYLITNSNSNLYKFEI